MFTNQLAAYPEVAAVNTKTTNFIMLFTEIQKYIQSFDLDSIPNERKSDLQPLIDYLSERITVDKSIRLNFICTHNSRRSHLCQIWAQTFAHYFQIKNVFCYSAGTEATALFPKITDTLTKVGFQIECVAQCENPIYSIKYTSNEQPIIGFSKTLKHQFNPSSEFASIMTCNHADKNCPFISGAEMRFSLPFEDPKAFDETPFQAEKYEERSLQIATEFFYVFSQLNF